MAQKLKLQEIAKPASLSKRLLAFAFDMLILNYIVIAPFHIVLESLAPGSSFSSAYSALSSNPSAISQLSLIYFIIGLLIFAYFTATEYRLQQTPGKMIMKLYVATKNNRLSLLQVMLRNLFLIPVFPFILLWPLELFFMLVRRDRKRFLEVLTNTSVVEYEKKLGI